jgi:hypothetical protein
VPQYCWPLAASSASQLTGSLPERRREEIREFLRGSLVEMVLVQKLSEVAAAFRAIYESEYGTDKSQYVDLGRVARSRREAGIAR